MKSVMLMLVSLILVSTNASAEFRAGSTWHLVKDTYLLKRSAKKLAKSAVKYVGDHTVSIEAKQFARVANYFVYKMNRYSLFTKRPDTVVIREDFKRVVEAFHRLRVTMRSARQINSIPKIMRRYDKLIYRYHRLRHSIDIHIAESTGTTTYVKTRPPKKSIWENWSRWFSWVSK